MMLIVLALTAWSATGVVFSMPEDVMDNTYDHAALNTTYTVGSDSNADMEPSYSDDKQDERGNEIPEAMETITSILKKFLPIQIENLSGTAKKNTLSLIYHIKNDLVRLTKNVFIDGPVFTQLLRKVKSLYASSPEVLDKAMFDVLTRHFENDYNFASVLIPMKNHLAKKEIIKILLDLQVKKWLDGKQDKATVFELLKLQKPNGNPFENPIFSQWVAFIEAKYPGNHDKKNEKMFEVLAKHFVGDHLTKILVVGAKSKVNESKELAQSLLDIHAQNWVKEGKKSYRDVFDLLQLHETNGNPLKSPIFLKWVNFVNQRYPSPATNYKVMLDILAKQFESKNALIGALVVGAETHGIKKVARILLRCQYKKWKAENKSADDVFKILELTESNLFSSPAFSAWVGFTKFRSSDDQDATKAMIATLEGVCKNDLGKILAEGTQIKRTKLVAKNLQKALKEGLPESSKRQYSDLEERPQPNREHDFDSNEPPAKRQHDFDLSEPPAKRQHDFDLNEALPESI